MTTQPKVLLVEDEPDTLELYHNALTTEGFQVVSANDPKDGLKLAKEERPDLILLDIMLPEMSGFEVLDRLKKDPETASIPVVALTNLAEEVGHEQAISRGAVNYIIKAERTPKQVALIVRQILQEANPSS